MAQSIPPLFYSFESDDLFKKCIECERPLDDDCDYVIEKAFRNYPGYKAKDVIFDYALCMNCALEIRESFSKKSLEAMDQYFAQHTQSRIVLVDEEGNFNVDECLSSCLVKGTKVTDLTEYQIYAHCRGKQLSSQIPPYMVSNEAVDDMLPLLSNETQDILNGFFNKHFSPDPSIMNPVPKIVLV
ncbi:MAG: hypothetical protein R8G66_31610 [Cytophagales bacterium]|nr:hypothetical protein [Cytophagales bacterium]